MWLHYVGVKLYTVFRLKNGGVLYEMRLQTWRLMRKARLANGEKPVELVDKSGTNTAMGILDLQGAFILLSILSFVSFIQLMIEVFKK